MKNQQLLQQFKCFDLEGGSMPTYWSAFEHATNDRAPEIIGVQETKV